MNRFDIESDIFSDNQIMCRREEGDYVLFADAEADKQQALADERARVREKEVKPRSELQRSEARYERAKCRIEELGVELHSANARFEMARLERDRNAARIADLAAELEQLRNALKTEGQVMIRQSRVALDRIADLEAKLANVPAAYNQANE